MTKTDDIAGFEVYYELSPDGDKWSLSVSIHKDGTGYGTGFILDEKPNDGEIVSRIAQEFAGLRKAKEEADSDFLNL